ncbi:MAG: hypothetical protein IPL94_11690 [Tetrasphaera sp.]|nr:hypothetical protein [Tetrasphaera sp.]
MSSRTPGRHRAPGRHAVARPRRSRVLALASPRELAGAAQAVGPRGALKSAAGLSVVAGLATALLLPSAESGDQALALSTAGSTAAAERSADGGSVSRNASSSRVALEGDLGSEAEEGALDAPTGPIADATSFGVSGVQAVPNAYAAALDPETVALVRYSLTAYAREGRGKGLTVNGQRVYSAVRSAFGLTNIGGLRPGDPLDHGSGRAIDVMITSKAQGDAVAAFVLAHAKEFNIKYVIWQQRSWKPERGAWRLMGDRGSPTQNHMDHVHISVL